MLELVAPPPSSAHRELYGSALGRNDEALLRRSSLGAELEAARSRLETLAIDHTPDQIVDTYYGGHREALSTYIGQQVIALHDIARTGRQRRQSPRMYLDLLDQLVLLPALFAYDSDEARQHRDRLICEDGIYGIIAEAIEDELEVKPAPASLGMRRWSGNINELTALGLLNRIQSADEAALPALPYEDETLKRDIIYYYLSAHQLHRRYPQIKTNEEHTDVAAADTRQFIGGVALGNNGKTPYWRGTGNYRTARAIVDEASGTATKYQIRTLDTITTELTYAIKAGRSFTIAAMATAA